MDKQQKKTPAPAEKPYDIPVGGSLGLLALGYRGLLAWRETKKQFNPNNPQQPQP